MASNRTRGVNLDFEALSRYGVDSNKKIMTKAVKAAKIKPKALSSCFEKDDMKYWSDPTGVNFISHSSANESEMDDIEGEADRSRSKSSSLDSEDEQNNKTLTKPMSEDDADSFNNQEVAASQKSDKSSVDPDSVSLHAHEDIESPVKIATKSKIAKKTAVKVAAKTKESISAELKAKQEEERKLKKECDLLEFEVLQSEKLQDNIDKYRQKIRDLKERKQGDCKPKVALKCKNKKKGSKPHSGSDIKRVCASLFEMLDIELSDTDESEFISALLDRAVKRKRIRKQKREKMRKSREASPSSSTSRDSSDSRSSSEERFKRSRSRSRTRSRSRSPKRKGKLKSGITEKPKEADLVMKVKWATALLGTKEEVKFDEMTFDQYIMGESQILNRVNISEPEKSTRIHLMKRISRLNEKLGFGKSKELYRETPNAIEKGEFTWCNYYEIERLENEIRFNSMKVEDNSPDERRKQTNNNQSEVKWCKDFNLGRCTFQSHHQGKYAGQVTKLWHICRVCWFKLKQKKFHRAGSEECQFTKQE